MRTSFLLAGLMAVLGLSLAAPILENITTANSVTAMASSELGWVRLCNGRRGEGTCIEVNALMSCQQLASPVRYNVQSLVQGKGTLCVYSQRGSCDNTNNAFEVISGSSEQSADVNPKWSPVLTSVICIPAPGPRKNSMDEIAASTTPTTDFSTSSPAGDALLCKTDINNGPCFKIEANNQCTDIVGAVDRQVRTIYQNKGSVCKYYKTDTCSGLLGTSDSTHQTINESVPPEFGHQLASVHCCSATRTSASTEAQCVAFDMAADDT
jgi:hypothetical protein